jgi:hypothetical protein
MVEIDEGCKIRIGILGSGFIHGFGVMDGLLDRNRWVY